MSVAALKAEMAGYLVRGLDDRANEVAAEIRRLGSDVETTAAVTPLDTPEDAAPDAELDAPEDAAPVAELDAPEDIESKAKPAPRKRIR